MNEIFYIDRETQQKEREKIYGHFFLEALYGKNIFSQWVSPWLLPLIAKNPFASHLYGLFQKSALSRFKIEPFIRTFHVDPSEFLDPISSFRSFNDFFIRKLKPQSRPIATGDKVATLPADGRYLVFQDLKNTEGFWVKGKKFSLSELLQDSLLAARYENGSMVIARLCPTDYHRFHFPTACTPGKAQPINGPLYSVNPIALQRNIAILSENKRVITHLDTPHFGTILYIEIGATHVGSIHQTYRADHPCMKGDEKGYFSFGGSCIIMLFEPNTITFDKDLIEPSAEKIEVRGLMGQSLGIAR